MQELKPGDIIASRYCLMRALGRGGMAEVFEAEDRVLERKVALKCLYPRYRDPSLIRRFLREAKAAIAIQGRHPAVVQVFDIGEAEGRAFIVMELLVGETLTQVLAAGDSPPAILVRALFPAFEALQAAHEVGIVHRDLKPDNLFFATDHQGRTAAKVMDFGIAKFGQEHRDAEVSITATGAFIGTPMYTAPEQLEGAPVGPGADIYALGSILYEIVTGRVPFGSTSVADLTARKLRDAPAPITEPGIPHQLVEIIMRCLARSPQARPGSVRELVDALALVLDAIKDLKSPRQRPSPSELGITALTRSVPPEFFTNASANRLEPPGTRLPALGSTVFGTQERRIDELRRTLDFYTKHVDEEYSQLSRHVDSIQRLWLAAIVTTLGITCMVVVLAALNHLTLAVATGVANIVPGWLIRVFRQREDHYRQLRDAKSRHLTYGRRWLMALQTADALDDPPARAIALDRICQTLLSRLADYSEADSSVNSPAGAGEIS